MGFEEVIFEKNSEKAIQNKPLKKALVNVTDLLRTAMNKAS
jgi:hypothetical protein